MPVHEHSEVHARWHPRVARRLRAVVESLPWTALPAVALVILQAVDCRSSSLDCERATAVGNEAVMIAVCQREYERTHQPRTGVRLAIALRRSGDARAASAVARSLLPTTAQADALYVLGKIAIDDKRFDDAETLLRAATARHRKDQRWREATKDLMALSEVAIEREDFSQALIILDDCILESRRAGDPVSEGYCHLVAGRMLRQIGYHKGARHELERADPLMTSQRNRVWWHLEVGNLHDALGDPAQAVVAFERALVAAEQVSLTIAALSAHLNLADALAQLRHWEEARRHLGDAASLDVDNAKRSERLVVAATIELAQGHLQAATELSAQAVAIDGASSRDDRLESSTLRATVALEAGDWPTAELWARQAVTYVERIHAAQPLVQLRSWIMERRRAPYDVLFLSLAHRGLAEAALASFDAWREHVSMNGPFLVARAPGDPDLHQLAMRSAQISEMVPAVVAGEPVAELRTPGTAANAVLALVVARSELWRITMDGGTRELRYLGKMSEYEELIDRFRTHPGDTITASRLGKLWIPAALLRHPGEVLHVVLDEPLALLPISMLRVQGQRLVAVRPIVRGLRPSDRTCVPRRPGPYRAMVVADVLGDLPGARRDAARVARRFPTTAVLGAAATPAVFWSAWGKDLLHIATHTEVDDLGGSLLLHGGRVSALEIAARGGAPAHVVVSTCGSAVARDGTYSLAAGFLAGGADQVIATLRQVSDQAAEQIGETLYQSATLDLVTALARAQASDDVEEFSSFAVFGRATCN